MASRSYVFTYNNPAITAQEFISKIEALPDVRYASFQLEQGEETGTPHWQGYIELRRPQRISWMRNNVLEAHYEKRQGTRQQARDYTRKADTRVEGPWEHGDWLAGGPGARTDLSGVAQACKSGSLKRVAEMHPQAVLRYSRVRFDFFFGFILILRRASVFYVASMRQEGLRHP